MDQDHFVLQVPLGLDLGKDWRHASHEKTARLQEQEGSTFWREAELATPAGDGQKPRRCQRKIEAADWTLSFYWSKHVLVSTATVG